MTSSTIDNPFAVHPGRRPRRLLVAAKGLAMVMTLFGGLVIAQAQSRRWLLDRWVSGLSDLPVTQQVERLLQIDALGDIATETLARRLAATDDTVAATAYELLRDHQNEWSSRDDRSLGRAHRNLAVGIESVASELFGNRIRWATELLNQSIVECVDRTVPEMDDAYASANRVVALLNPPSSIDRSTESIALSPSSISPVDNVPRLLPLPVRVQSAEDESLSQLAVDTPPPPTETIQTPATAASTNEPITLLARPAPTLAAATENDSIRDSIQPVRQLTHSSLEAFDTKSVIQLLGASTAKMHDQAVDELVRRGLSNEEIRVANQLASPILDVRLGLLDSIANRTDVDPRPWLLWLAEDANREVRLRAISSLASMNDPAVKKALRGRLAAESDQTVAARIRRAVDVR